LATPLVSVGVPGSGSPAGVGLGEVALGDGLADVALGDGLADVALGLGLAEAVALADGLADGDADGLGLTTPSLAASRFRPSL
jgi:hypothetical protein